MIRRVTKDRIDQEMLIPSTSFEYLSATEEYSPTDKIVRIPIRMCRDPMISASSLPEIKHVDPSGHPVHIPLPAGAQVAYYTATERMAAPHYAFSVVTDPVWHQGSMLDLYHVRRELDMKNPRPPIIMKDFIIHEQQILSAKTYGADIVLLIASLLSEEELKDLNAFALRIGLETLIEVNSVADMNVALRLPAKIVGVNTLNVAMRVGASPDLEDLINQAIHEGIVVCRRWIGLSTILD
jgi:indole-3-glycerol phosphate synthase